MILSFIKAVFSVIVDMVTMKNYPLSFTFLVPALFSLKTMEMIEKGFSTYSISNGVFYSSISLFIFLLLFFHCVVETMEEHNGKATL